MWRSVFLHEFIDHRISNFQALPGQATAASLALTPTRDAASGVNSMLVRSGAEFDFRLKTPIHEVIGITCRVRLSYPTFNQPDFGFPLFRLGSGAALFLKTQFGPSDLNRTMTSPGVQINGFYSSFKRVDLAADRFVDFRFDWHTSGQARILLDDQLVAYQNAVSPGELFAVDRVVFGMPQQSSTFTPTYRVSRVFVRVLTRKDSLDLFSRLLPAIENPSGDPRRCRQRSVTNLLALVDRLRGFMASIHQTLSTPWSQQAGPATGPFQPQAIQAHELAVKSVTALATMLRTGDYSAPDRFLQPFTTFLHILHSAQPAQFEALAAELRKTKVVPEDCKDTFEASARQNKEALQPVIDLLSAAAERVNQIAGGH